MKKDLRLSGWEVTLLFTRKWWVQFGHSIGPRKCNDTSVIQAMPLKSVNISSFCSIKMTVWQLQKFDFFPIMFFCILLCDCTDIEILFYWFPETSNVIISFRSLQYYSFSIYAIIWINWMWLTVAKTTEMVYEWDILLSC